MALEFRARARSPIPLDIAFRVEPGELLALVGHSGAGKSTVLRTIAGLWRPSSGLVRVGDEVWLDTDRRIDVRADRRRVGLVFQSYALFPHLSAEANVAIALGDLSGEPRREEARRLLAMVHLDGLERRRPARLSGGQQQRVALARALARRPAALLLDEPFSAVDRATREGLYREIAALRAHLSMPSILVTHDIDEARLLADRMVLIEQGVVLCAGSMAELAADPLVLRATGLHGMASFIEARVVAQEPDGLTRLECAAGTLMVPRIDAAEGSAVRIRVPAHEVLLSVEHPVGLSALNVLAMQIESVEPADSAGLLVRLRAGPVILVASVTQRSIAQMQLGPGRPCYAILKSMAASPVLAAQQAAAGPGQGNPDQTPSWP